MERWVVVEVVVVVVFMSVAVLAEFVSSFFRSRAPRQLPATLVDGLLAVSAGSQARSQR